MVSTTGEGRGRLEHCPWLESVLIDVGRNRDIALLSVPPLELVVLSARVERNELGREANEDLDRVRVVSAASGRREDEVSRGVKSISFADDACNPSSVVLFRLFPRARLAMLLNDAAALDLPRFDDSPRFPKPGLR